MIQLMHGRFSMSRSLQPSQEAHAHSPRRTTVNANLRFQSEGSFNLTSPFLRHSNQSEGSFNLTSPFLAAEAMVNNKGSTSRFHRDCRTQGAACSCSEKILFMFLARRNQTAPIFAQFSLNSGRRGYSSMVSSRKGSSSAAAPGGSSKASCTTSTGIGRGQLRQKWQWHLPPMQPLAQIWLHPPAALQPIPPPALQPTFPTQPLRHRLLPDLLPRPFPKHSVQHGRSCAADCGADVQRSLKGVWVKWLIFKLFFGSMKNQHIITNI